MIRFLQSGNKAAKYLLAALLAVLCLSMVTYLIPGFMSGSSINETGVVAKIGGQEISTQDVQRVVTQIRQQQRLRGQDFPESFSAYLNQQAIQQLLQQAELRYEAERLGFTASDQEVRDFLRTGPYAETFFPQGNWIGQDKYEELLRDAQTTEADFVRDLRFEILKEKLIAAASAGVTVAPSEIERAYKEQNTKVKFDYAVINADDVEKQINPTETELKAFYDANKARYANSIPEKRQARYFVIPLQTVESKVTVNAVDIEGYYRDHQEDYRVPDQVKVRQIQVSIPAPAPGASVDQKAVDVARAKAADVLKQLKAGGDFAELAKKYSDDPGSKEKGGEIGIGWVQKGQLPADFEKIAFAQSKGQTSDLVQLSDGFHIIQTEDKEIAHIKPLSEVKDSIEKTVKEQKTSDQLNQMATAAETQARTESLDKAAAKYGAQVIETKPISRRDVLAGVGASPDVMNAIFMADKPKMAQSVQTAQGDLIFEVEKIVPPATPAFEEIKDRVTADFRRERVNTLVSQKTADLSDRARALHDLRKAAKEQKLTVKTSELVGRESQVPEVGAMAGSASAAFGMKAGEISKPLNASRNGLVIALIDRQEPSLSAPEFAKANDNLREQLIQKKRQEALELFFSNLDQRLRKEKKLKTNDAVVARLMKTAS